MKSKTALITFLATFGVGVAATASANWERVPVQACSADSYHNLIGERFYTNAVVTGEALLGSADLYCPVPDTNDLPVTRIATYEVSGSTTTAGHRVRACIQFNNGSGTACAPSQALPQGTFTNFRVTVPSLWQEHWHSAFVHFQKDDGGYVRVRRIFVKD